MPEPATRPAIRDPLWMPIALLFLVVLSGLRGPPDAIPWLVVGLLVIFVLVRVILAWRRAHAQSTEE
jgi:hypothetical protein